mmetsp:Transcript_46519/g.51851  ORF Transcript_46519/g.51851 Transcript_46519/m.51851 type:complete len:159 (+) Transcript_46519:113-589(+)
MKAKPIIMILLVVMSLGVSFFVDAFVPSSNNNINNIFRPHLVQTYYPNMVATNIGRSFSARRFMSEGDDENVAAKSEQSASTPPPPPPPLPPPPPGASTGSNAIYGYNTDVIDDKFKYPRKGIKMDRTTKDVVALVPPKIMESYLDVYLHIAKDKYDS